MFAYVSFGIIAVSTLCQLIVITHNNLSASFLVDEDEYWTLYHFKPFNRIQGYLIGVWLGCSYHTYKYGAPLALNAQTSESSEEDKKQKGKLF
jgi:hypothetical protein